MDIQKLKTIEVDIEKKVFKVNGESFGRDCSGFRISCDTVNWWEIQMDIDTTIHYKKFDKKGNKTN